MLLVKVLKRKDASSVLVAILLAMIISQPLAMTTGKLAGFLSGVSDEQYISYSYPGADWKVAYLQPIVWVLVQIFVLEMLALVYVFARESMRNKK